MDATRQTSRSDIGRFKTKLMDFFGSFAASIQPYSKPSSALQLAESFWQASSYDHEAVIAAALKLFGLAMGARQRNATRVLKIRTCPTCPLPCPAPEATLTEQRKELLGEVEESMESMERMESLDVPKIRYIRCTSSHFLKFLKDFGSGILL